jgi:cell division protein FtsB|tara:strand:+ start:195 stop:848 length:654 start_codon:yes stop_codon:yes gene_type:complete
MAEVEVGGVKFTGGKMFAVITALSTLGGVAWGGFEFYNDYRNMKEQIQEYVAPDLSGLQEQLSVLTSELQRVEQTNATRLIAIDDSVIKALDYTRDIRNQLKADIQSLEAKSDSTEARVKKTEDNIEAQLEASEARLKVTQQEINNTLEIIRTQMDVIRVETSATLREIEGTVRESEKDVRDNMRETEARIDDAMDRLDIDISKKLQEALDNPLNDM